MLRRIRCVGLAALGLASAASANDALLAEALGRPAVPVAEVNGVVRTTSQVKGGDEPETETEVVDPRKEPSKALPSYAVLKSVVGNDARRAAGDPDRMIYTFTTRTVPKGSMGTGKAHVTSDGDDQESYDGTAEVIMDASGHPYISHIALRLQKPVGGFFANVKVIDFDYDFAPTPAAGFVATGMKAHVDVRALLFVHRDVHVESVLVPAIAGVPSKDG
ncbi:hypothetical protein [Luteibacter aegosomatissinici]|uniref:hypothetical protein n=1 Tax=Luteibacter aegosomatissinici TaxID=2911539 RepID=UPI001FF96791|nr:hypothetical protein [Luteibacter aegosomatissinici]UPG93011.1 hypothetical protein L2Y97_14165 [Luteibacter aegosomatissinici]